MFRKLRNKFILFNAGITAVVVAIVFSIIYATATQSALRRPPMEPAPTSYTNDVKNIVIESIRAERNKASRELLSILVFSGFVIEACVAVISYFLAEIAIKPVKEAYESQKIFVANASHEIKTPLAAIEANLEAADIRDNKWLRNVEDETKKITDLNNSLLRLAKADLMVESHRAETIDLKKLVEKELEVFWPRFEEKGITLKRDLVSCVKNVNAKDLREVLDVLLDNALKYCESKIEVELSDDKIVVKNDGKLIPADKLTHIFERFYQVDKSAEGVGLGLSIALAIAERNGWKVEARVEEERNVFSVMY